MCVWSTHLKDGSFERKGKFDWKGLESGNLKSPLFELLDQKPSVAKEEEDEGFEI